MILLKEIHYIIRLESNKVMNRKSKKKYTVTLKRSYKYKKLTKYNLL